MKRTGPHVEGFTTLTAHTLNSGILATGSRAGFVSKLVRVSAKWNVMKTTPPEEMEFKINSLKETEPMLARAVEARIKLIQKGASGIEPLPEQKPPRRGADKAVV